MFATLRADAQERPTPGFALPAEPGTVACAAWPASGAGSAYKVVCTYVSGSELVGGRFAGLDEATMPVRRSRARPDGVRDANGYPAGEWGPDEVAAWPEAESLDRSDRIV